MCTDLNGVASLKRVSFYLQLVTGNISLNTVKCHYKNKDQFWLWLNVCVACDKEALPRILFVCLSFKVDGKEVHLNTRNIKYFLELNQVGLVQDDPQLWAHSDPVSTKTTFTKDKVPIKIILLIITMKH